MGTRGQPLTWATRITIARILLIPVFLWVLLTYYHKVLAGIASREWRYAAVIIFAVASISDALDGYLARRWNQKSELGSILDPIADKLLSVTSLITLAFMQRKIHFPIPLWFPVIIIAKDLVLGIVFACFMFYKVKVEVKPHWSGKFATVLTCVAIISGLLRWPVTYYICFIGAFATLFSSVLYIRDGLMLRHPAPTA